MVTPNTVNNVGNRDFLFTLRDDENGHIFGVQLGTILQIMLQATLRPDSFPFGSLPCRYGCSGRMHKRGMQRVPRDQPALFAGRAFHEMQ